MNSCVKITMVLFVLYATGCAKTSVLFDGTKVANLSSETEDSAITIPYEKLVLDNGLTVILHEDRSDPIVHVDVTYHVGSAHEEIGKSGFAHFFEHMMFQGSENVADEAHFKIVTEAGGSLNGTTNTDRTNYFQTVPSNQLEKILWLEADRMGFLLPAMTQEKFEIQRETVKNERSQRVDNRPYGLLPERVGEALYPEGHPYSWQPIGYIDDLNRVNVNDLKEFFLRWYGPNNATLTIGGDFNRKQTLEWVDKYFGSIPSGPEVEKPEKIAFALEADRYISMEDNVSLPMLYMAIPTVHVRHPDEAPLDVLTAIIGRGATSLLYKNMVKNGLAVQAGAGHGCAELSCTFTISALPDPASGADLSDLNRIIGETFDEFETRGVEDDDLTQLKAMIMSSMIYGLESVADKVSQLAINETLFDQPDLIASDIQRYENVTKADVVRVYEQYIKGRPAVFMSVVPKGQLDMVAAPDSWQRYERTLPLYENLTEDNIDYRVATDDFDRSIEPAATAIPAVSLPSIWSDITPNGIAVIGAVNDEVPTTTIQFRIKIGQRSESLDKLGLTSLTASMLNESTIRSTRVQLSNQLQKLGSQVNFRSNDDYIVVSIRTLSKNIDETLEIAAEKIFEPKFDEADFDRLKNQRIQSIKRPQNDARYLAENALRAVLYGADNSFVYDDRGTIDGVGRISLDDVKTFYSEAVREAFAEIIVVSDLNSVDLLSKFVVFSEWDGAKKHLASLEPYPVLDTGAIYLIDKPDAPQTEIRIASRAMTYDATGPFYRATLMNFVLGGAFNSRINLNLREDKGYTYGAQSAFSGSKYTGNFTASAAVKKDATAASIQEFFDEIESYNQNGITDEELSFMRRSISQREARAYETPRQKVGLIAQILTYYLEPDFMAEQQRILLSMTKNEINTLARDYLQPDEMIVIAVGDKAEILPQLETLDFKIVEIDMYGNPL